MTNKEELLTEFVKLSKDKSQDDMLPLLLAFSKKAKKEGIHFEKDEVLTMIDAFAKDMPREKVDQIKMLAKTISS